MYVMTLIPSWSSYIATMVTQPWAKPQTQTGSWWGIPAVYELSRWLFMHDAHLKRTSPCTVHSAVCVTHSLPCHAAIRFFISCISCCACCKCIQLTIFLLLPSFMLTDATVLQYSHSLVLNLMAYTHKIFNATKTWCVFSTIVHDSQDCVHRCHTNIKVPSRAYRNFFRSYCKCLWPLELILGCAWMVGAEVTHSSSQVCIERGGPMRIMWSCRTSSDVCVCNAVVLVWG